MTETSQSLAFLISKVGCWYLIGVPRGERRLQGTRCGPGVTEQPSVVASITPSLSHRTASSLKTEIKPFDSVDSAFTRYLHHEETVRDTRPVTGRDLLPRCWECYGQPLQGLFGCRELPGPRSHPLGTLTTSSD